MSLFKWGTKPDGTQRTFREVYFGVDDKPKRKAMTREWKDPKEPPYSPMDVWVATTDGSVIYGWYESTGRVWRDRIFGDNITNVVIGWMEMNKPAHPRRS